MTTKEIEKVKSAISLLSAMIAGGVYHSGTSLQIKNEVMDILNNHQTKSKEEAEERYEKGLAQFYELTGISPGRNVRAAFKTAVFGKEEE